MGKEINKGGRKPITMTDEQVSQIEALGSVLSIEQARDGNTTATSTQRAMFWPPDWRCQPLESL